MKSLNNSEHIKVSVVGLGFVGRPIVEACLSSEFEVIGIDINPEKLETSLRDFQNLKFKATSNLEEVSHSQIIILALPTPINPDGSSDLSALEQVSSNISSFVDENTLIIIESTYAPYTTRNVIAPLLCAKSGLNFENLLLAYSPERINPGDKYWNLRNTPKLLAGLNEKSLDMAKNFYSKFIDSLVMVDSLEIAETAKLLENIYRFVNISLVNEFQRNCEALGIEASKVIEAASSKPFGFQAFFPGIGIGGHCIPIAPIHFKGTLASHGASNGFIEYGIEINRQQILFIIEKIEREFFKLDDKRILVVGVTYKPAIPDIRESISIILINHLRKRGINVSWYDSLIDHFNGECNNSLEKGTDLALICIEQPNLILSNILEKCDTVLDISAGLEIKRLK